MQTFNNQTSQCYSDNRIVEENCLTLDSFSLTKKSTKLASRKLNPNTIRIPRPNPVASLAASSTYKRSIGTIMMDVRNEDGQYSSYTISKVHVLVL